MQLKNTVAKKYQSGFEKSSFSAWLRKKEPPITSIIVESCIWPPTNPYSGIKIYSHSLEKYIVLRGYD